MKLFQYLTRRQKVFAAFSVTVTIILLILDLILILSLRDTVTSTNEEPTSTSPPFPTTGGQSTSASTSASTFSSSTSDQSSTDSSPSSTDTDTTSVTSEQSTTISSTTATTSVSTTTAPVEQVLFVNDEQIFKLPSFEKLESSECDVTNANSHDGSLGVAGIVHDENMDLRLLIGGFTSVDYWYVRTETGWIQVESSRQER